jgi:hypothetical protein
MKLMIEPLLNPGSVFNRCREPDPIPIHQLPLELFHQGREVRRRRMTRKPLPLPEGRGITEETLVTKPDARHHSDLRLFRTAQGKVGHGEKVSDARL